jgi:hypothetical protein
MGFPVIVANTPGVREYFCDDEVFFVSPTDSFSAFQALRNIWYKPELLQIKSMRIKRAHDVRLSIHSQSQELQKNLRLLS